MIYDHMIYNFITPLILDWLEYKFGFGKLNAQKQIFTAFYASPRQYYLATGIRVTTAWLFNYDIRFLTPTWFLGFF